MGTWQRSESYTTLFSSVHMQLNETKAKRNTIIIIIIIITAAVKGIFFLTCSTYLTYTVTSVFPVSTHSPLMTLWSYLLNDQERLVSITLPLGVIRYYRGLLGSGPHLDYEWESSEWAGTPSDSNRHSGTAVGCDCSWSMKNLTRPKDETITWDCFSKLLLSKCFFFLNFLKKRVDLLEVDSFKISFSAWTPGVTVQGSVKRQGTEILRCINKKQKNTSAYHSLSLYGDF